MPTLLTTTVRHIYDRVPNSVNSQLIADFNSYVKDNATPERHQNNNLKAIIAFAEFLGSEITFFQTFTKDQVTKFLDTKIRSNSDDPEQQCIATCCLITAIVSTITFTIYWFFQAIFTDNCSTAYTDIISYSATPVFAFTQMNYHV
jgi:hypothetical protein